MTRWPLLDRTSTERVRTLTRKLTSSPTLPLLGWTKAVESLITSPETLVPWVGYATVVTAAWVFADDLADVAAAVDD